MIAAVQTELSCLALYKNMPGYVEMPRHSTAQIPFPQAYREPRHLTRESSSQTA